MPQEMIVNSVAVEMKKKKASPADQKLLQDLVRSTSVTEAIPDDIKAEDFHDATRVVCMGIARSQLITDGLMPFLGRLLSVAKERPELWNKKYEKHEDYLSSLTQTYGVGRTTLFDARKLYSRWGKVLEPSRFEAIGRVSLMVITRAVPRGDEGKATARKLLDIGESKTVRELVDYCVDKGYLEKGEAAGGSFSFPCNQKQAKIFHKFFGDDRVHAYCESSHAADILEHMVEECIQEWIEKGEAIMEERAGKVVEASA